MKKLLLLAIGLFLFQAADAQVKAGLKLGVSTMDISEPGEVVFDSIKYQMSDAGYGIHVGGFLRLPLGPIYLQTEPMFGTSRIDYRVSDLSSGSEFMDELKQETLLKLDMPILVGTKLFKVLRVQGGAVGSIVLDSSGDIRTMDGVATTWEGMTWGAQVGAGLDLGKKLTLDVNYESNLSNWGDTLEVGNQSFDLDTRASRWVITIGYNFL